MNETAAAHKSPNYFAVFGWLVALTVFEVGITYLKLDRQVLAGLLIGSSLAKATLVALYFMHLRHEVKLIVITVVVCLVLSAVYVLGLVPDIVLG